MSSAPADQAEAAPRKIDPRLIASLAAVYLIWSSTYLGMKVAIHTFPPMVLGAMRFLGAGSILLLMHRLRGGRMPTRGEVLRAAPVGALLFVAGNGFIALAQEHVASGVAAIVASTTPLWVAVLGPLFGERARAAEWIGIGLGTTGVALLASSAELGGDVGMIILLLLGPVGWALGSIFVRKLPQAPGVSAPALHMLWGGTGMALLWPILGESFPSEVSGEAIAIVAYLVVFGSLVGFTAFNWLLRNTRPTLALSYSYVNPAIAVLLGAALGGEPVHATTLAATGVLGIAVAVVIREATRKRRAENR